MFTYSKYVDMLILACPISAYAIDAGSYSLVFKRANDGFDR